MIETFPLPAEQKSDHINERTVVLIDDDVDQLSVMRARLESRGFRTAQSTLGWEGFEQVKSVNPALVILDLNLPDVHGFKICEEITDNPATCEIPVIIVSGLEDPQIVRKTRSCGATFYLRKPYDPNALLLLAEQAINESNDW